MSSSIHTHAAEQRAILGITNLLADSHFTAETAGHAAAEIMARLAADGWHHTSEHGKPPETPKEPDPPNDEFRRARAEIASRPRTANRSGPATRTDPPEDG